MRCSNGRPPPNPADSLLKEVVQRILSVRRPAAIILFGSSARHQTREDSDLDLLIIEQHNSLPRYRRAVDYRMALLGIDRDIDLVVYTPEEIREWSSVPNAFITTILREGRVLYEDESRLGQRLVG
jgi:predicted nucleotidyltransferase